MGNSRGLVSAEDVRNVVFSPPPAGKRGYNSDDVDSLLRQIEACLESRNQLSADDVRNVVFRKPPLFRRGYNEDEVDEFLERVVATLQGRGR